jgi:DNA-binding CsgD family transcriptional regulator
MQATSNYGLDQVRYYFEALGHYDEPKVSRALAASPPLTLVTDQDVWGDVTVLEDRPDYRYLRENFGIRRRGGVRLSSEKGWMDLLALQYDRLWTSVSGHTPRMMMRLLPHLAKAVEINRTFALLRSSYGAVVGALDHLHIGIFVVAPPGIVVAGNREGQRIVEMKDGMLRGHDGRLRCSEDVSGDALVSALAEVCATASAEGETRERLLLVKRRSLKRPLIVEIVPLRDGAGEFDRDLAGAVVYIVDPENTRALSALRMAQVFGLTRAETAVAQGLLDGTSLRDIADQRGTTEMTVKTQVKSVYAKTGARRRSDLVRLAVSVDPPIDRAGIF